MTWARSIEEAIVVAAPAAAVFAWLDQPANTGLHMSRPSLAMMGGALRVERLSRQTTGVGAAYRSWGRVLGLTIDFTTVVTKWLPDRDKVWRTTGEPRLIVLGHFQMRSALVGHDGSTKVVLAIDYDLPPSGLGRLLGWALAGPYVRWCLRRMAHDAQAALDSHHVHARS